MSTLDLSVANLIEDHLDMHQPASNILDNYDLTHNAFTRGIRIDRCTFNGSHNFSIWEFSGYEPYKLLYDHFIGDQNCIHLLVYDLSQSLDDCFAECLDHLEFLRSRISAATASRMPVVFIGTHADLDRTCTRKDPDSPFISDKADQLRLMLRRTYVNDDLFDLDEKHFVLDARAAWVTDIKVLIEHLIKLKQSICERLPRSTMFLNRALFHVQNWRKELTIDQPGAPTTNNKYPVISLRNFNERIRECINPLASDEHLNELVQQLQLMGEIVFLEFRRMNSGEHMICFQPEWLCGRVLGHLFAFERYVDISPGNLNGVYTGADLATIFASVCTNTRLLKDIFVALELCVELTNEKTGEPVYEFPALNFLSEALPLAFHVPKQKQQQKPTLYILNGFQLRTTAFHLGHSNKTAYSFRQLATLFFRIQVNLRYLTKNFYLEPDDKQSKPTNTSTATTTNNSSSISNNSSPG
jgi:death-associated protein kinase